MGLSAPVLGLIGYIHVYDHNIQTSLKLLGQSKPNFMWSIVRKGVNGHGHMTKMANMVINSKNL